MIIENVNQFPGGHAMKKNEHEIYCSKDGKTDFSNFEKLRAEPNFIEKMIAFSLNKVGIEKIFGYKTTTKIGVAEAFDNESKESKGKVVLQTYGFEKGSV